MPLTFNVTDAEICSQLSVSRLRADHQAFTSKRLMIGPEPWNSELQTNFCVCYVVLHLRVSIKHRPPRSFSGSHYLPLTFQRILPGNFQQGRVLRVHFVSEERVSFSSTCSCEVSRNWWRKLKVKACCLTPMAKQAITASLHGPAVCVKSRWSSGIEPATFRVEFEALH